MLVPKMNTYVGEFGYTADILRFTNMVGIGTTYFKTTPHSVLLDVGKVAGEIPPKLSGA